MDSVTNFYSNPLQIVFLWHPDDGEKVSPIIEYVRKMFSPDLAYPFSHSIHLPIRFCTSLNAHIPAFCPEIEHAQQTLIFAFIGDSIIASETDSDDKNWYNFIKSNLIRKR